MRTSTASLWAQQNVHPGDRLRLFRAVREAVPAETVLYAGSFCDVTPSFVFPDVTYVDLDRRAATFFDDVSGVQEVIRVESGSSASARVRFIPGDYASPLPIEDESLDLLISLYAGFVSESCTRYLRVGGVLLAHPSHGDAALASIDPHYTLWGVVLSRGGAYRVATADLGGYLVPKGSIAITADTLHQLGRGIGYTKPAFAYLFERVQ